MGKEEIEKGDSGVNQISQNLASAMRLGKEERKKIVLAMLKQTDVPRNANPGNTRVVVLVSPAMSYYGKESVDALLALLKKVFRGYEIVFVLGDDLQVYNYLEKPFEMASVVEKKIAEEKAKSLGELWVNESLPSFAKKEYEVIHWNECLTALPGFFEKFEELKKQLRDPANTAPSVEAIRLTAANFTKQKFGGLSAASPEVPKEVKVFEANSQLYLAEEYVVLLLLGSLFPQRKRVLVAYPGVPLPIFREAFKVANQQGTQISSLEITFKKIQNPIYPVIQALSVLHWHKDDEVGTVSEEDARLAVSVAMRVFKALAEAGGYTYTTRADFLENTAHGNLSRGSSLAIPRRVGSPTVFFQSKIPAPKKTRAADLSQAPQPS